MPSTSGQPDGSIRIASCPALAATLRIVFGFLDRLDWGLPPTAARPLALLETILAARLIACTCLCRIHTWTIGFRTATPVAPQDAFRWYIFAKEHTDPGSSVLVDLAGPQARSTGFIQLGLCAAAHPPFVTEGLRLAGWGRPFTADDADLATLAKTDGVMDMAALRGVLASQGRPRHPRALLLD
jgi:hypothetical protein